MQRKDKNRLPLAGKIREERLRQKNSTYTRPEGSEEVGKKSSGLFSGYSKDEMSDMNKSMKNYWDSKKKKKTKSGILKRLFGGGE